MKTSAMWEVMQQHIMSVMRGKKEEEKNLSSATMSLRCLKLLVYWALTKTKPLVAAIRARPPLSECMRLALSLT